MGSKQPRQAAAAAPVSSASSASAAPADASIRSRHSSSSVNKSSSNSSNNSNNSVIEKAQRISQRDMLRAGPREQATALGHETDPNELMELGSAAGAHQRKSSAYAAVNNNNNSNKKEASFDESDKDGESKRKHAGSSLSPQDQRAMVLLVLLYLLQGIPVGLAFGSIPYLLRAKLSYSQIGIFSLASYPYSMKLLWSPIVDTWYNSRIGRRKSWVIPIQFIVGAMLWWLSNNVQSMIDKEIPDVGRLTFVFFTLVFFAATQDIAVDGWALTLLSQDNLSYASTAQTIGLNTGYFLSFTVFLAFNSVEFSNRYFRTEAFQSDIPLLTLPGYLKSASIGFFAITSYLLFANTHDPEEDAQEAMGVKKVYSVMYSICRLKHVQSFLIVHLIAKLGTATDNAATSLKLLEKGLQKEDLALAVLLDFPFQLIFGYLAARWSKGEKPLRPWIGAMWIRLAFAVASMLLVAYFPSTQPIGFAYFLLILCTTIFSSFAQTVQFVGISAFHTQIADPVIGGTYMTLLNTVSNLGGTWPRYFVLSGIDSFTQASCRLPSEDIVLKTHECVSEHGKATCASVGGECVTDVDGYYIVSGISLLLGICILFFFIRPTAHKLHTLDTAAWRVKLD